MPLEPAPTHVLAHLSDTHLLAGGAALHGVDTVENLRRALERLESSGVEIDAIVHTGDITDLGELDAYHRVRELVEPVAERLGAAVVWVAGNHDIRGPLREGLLGQPPSDAPFDTVTEVGGLRIIGLDSSVPLHGHGDLDGGQLDWLRDVLADPAPHGTVLAVHHPPIPTVVRELQTLQLRAVPQLAEVIAGTDVRAILSGHFHYTTTGALAAIPVSVVTASSYTIRVDGPDRGLTGVDGGQGLGLLHLYADGAVHSELSLAEYDEVVHLPFGFFDQAP
ncbi:metallophosphoesterase [Herbiconiux sp. L3-i23]|uniref:metallophosphoesterase n=1 Tax=Herbiconiux sp. L3-i23 TaxID=2905871 RepID=UPI00204524AF|nr:metallophosphoesterase [Herbiconiux sp. L3-i23]BDI21915.1 3',5'-cyclic adenosine monophosphate phosphodiesterase CpdA [Herbiconiux sp. L3-i23]